MIEGLRLLPWFYEAVNHDPEGMAMLSDCENCKASMTRSARRAIACGYEVESAGALAWDHRVHKGNAPAVCAGYTCKLPEVVEIARAYAHWENGSIESFCDGAPPELVQIALEVLAGSVREIERARLTPASKGGLAEG